MLINKIRGYIRIVFLALATAFFIPVVAIGGIVPSMRYRWGLRVRNVWAGVILFILGYRVKMKGRIPEGTYLFVGNHRSSLDPLVCLRYLRASPVSRADVRNYPFVGKGAEMTGIIFVDKESKASRSATKQAIYDALKGGKSVMIYPEGKTNALPLTATFQKGSFDVAAELGIPVIPFAEEYEKVTDYWDHSETMVVHYMKNLAKARTRIRISVGEPIQSDNAWSLLRQSQQWINDEIIELRKDWGGLAPGPVNQMEVKEPDSV